MKTITRYTVLGASGNTGHRIARQLLAAGKEVRVTGRSAERLEELADLGAKVEVGDLNDEAFLDHVLQDAEAIYALIPPNYISEDYLAFQKEVASKIAAAVSRAGVKRVVGLSTVGAGSSESSPLLNGLYNLEMELNKVEGLNARYLRAAYFMENLMTNVQLVKSASIFGSMLNPDQKHPMIATKDIADRAVDLLLDPDWEGIASIELQGQRDLTLREITGIVGSLLGTDTLPFVQFSAADAGQAMRDGGMSENMAGLLVQLHNDLNENNVHFKEARSEANTTATSIEDFLKENFIPALETQAV